MNQETMQGKWQEIKGEIRTKWGKLTDDDLEATKGNLESIAGLIHQRYGDAKEAVSEKVVSIFDSFSKDSKRSAADNTEAVKESLRDSKQPH